jgi:diaminopimelate epimerase
VTNLKFYKYQSIGNDFVLIDKTSLLNWQSEFEPETAKIICDRNFGVGSDGLIIVSNNEMIFLNPDGTYDVCGNGIRCVADYLFNKNQSNSTEIVIQNQIIKASKNESGLITTYHENILNFGDKKFLDFNGVLVNSGTPHYCINSNPSNFILEQFGPIIEKQLLDSETVSVDIFEFNQNSDKSDVIDINLRIWERSVGETLGCGTAALAVTSVVSQITNCKLFNVFSKGGVIQSKINENSTSLTAQAKCVFSGLIDL